MNSDDIQQQIQLALGQLVAQLEKLQEIQREQTQELRELRQDLSSYQSHLPHKTEEILPTSEPDPPPLVRHLTWASTPLRILAKPLSKVTVTPLRWLMGNGFKWLIFAPLNYVLFAPVGYALHKLSPTSRLLNATAKIEDKKWEKRLDNLSSALGELGVIKLTASAMLIVGYLVFAIELSERGKARQYQAWSVVNTGASVEPDYDYVFEDAEEGEERKVKLDEGGEKMRRVRRGSTGEGGRIKALQELYADNQPLSGLQAQGAYLVGINLGGWCLNFLGDFAPSSCLKLVDLEGANLQGANLWEANLQDAYLWKANLQDAYLWQAKLQGANLWEANLQDAYLVEANLQDAFLWEANLQDADLENANFQGAILLGTHLQTAEYLTKDQLEPALLCAAKLPPAIDLPPDRDCEKLPSILVDKFDWLKTEEEAQDYIDENIDEIRKTSQED